MLLFFCKNRVYKNKGVVFIRKDTLKKMEKGTENFLRNNDFISWRLTRDPYLESYWEEYIEMHPEQKEAFEKAVWEFSRIQLNKETLSDTEQADLLKRIHASRSQTRRKKRLSLMVRYSAAACITLIIGISIFYYTQTANEGFPLPAAGLIVGENLDNEEIRLISGAETSSFSGDVHVQISKQGAILVEEEGAGSKEIGANTSAMTKLVVPYGKRSQLILSDGSKIWINSGSVLEFPAKFTGSTRTVKLTGEMYAEVIKDTQRPFIVSTGGFQVHVYGTKFNVSAYPDQVSQSVVLVRGSVAVKSPTLKETRLQPNEMLTRDHSAWNKEQVDVSGYICWKDGIIILNSTPITDVLKQVQRYYNLTFDIPQTAYLEKITCTGKIYLSEDLDNVMETIAILSSTQYQRKGKTIYININNPKENTPMQ